MKKLWTLHAYHLLLTIDLLDDYVRMHTFETFCESPTAIENVVINLKVISQTVEAIPAGEQARFPDVPWSMLRNLNSVLSDQTIRRDPRVAWIVLTRRVLNARHSIFTLVEKSQLELSA